MSGRLVDELDQRGVGVYLPRGSDAEDETLQMFVEYLLLAESLTVDGRTDDLALRSLLELCDNRIGAERIWAAVVVSRDRRMRFSEALEHLRSHPADFRSTGLRRLLNEADRISVTAEGLAQRDGEDFRAWLQRASEALGVGHADADNIRQVAAAVIDELDDVADDKQRHASSFTRLLVGALSRLGDALPPSVPGQVTITTMHGAKGLSAEVVVVLRLRTRSCPARTRRMRPAASYMCR